MILVQLFFTILLAAPIVWGAAIGLGSRYVPACRAGFAVVECRVRPSKARM